MDEKEEAHVRRDAYVTATYLQKLVQEGVALPHAIALTIEYVRSMIMARHVQDATRPPKEPWE